MGFGTSRSAALGADRAGMRYVPARWRWTEDRRRTLIVRGRKVRAPQGGEVANSDPGQPEGKRNRNHTADG